MMFPYPAPALRSLASHALALAACGLTAVLTMPLRETLDLANIVMLFLLVVFLVALRLGRGPAVAAAVASVALFDFIFVPPHLGFIPTDAQYLVTLAVMLAVALTTAQLTASAREQTLLACAREHQTEQLYQLARNLAGARCRRDVQSALDAYFQDDGCRARLQAPEGTADTNGAPVPTPEPSLCLPLDTATGNHGGLIVIGEAAAGPAPLHKHDELVIVASLVAIAVERLESVAAAEEARVQAASDKLRASLLSALSHDLRTPLTALVGMADSLALGRIPADTSPQEAASIIRDQARSMEHLLGNLLEMARLQSGRVVLRKEWQLLDDLIAASLRHLRLAQETRPVRVQLAPELPLVHFDAVLMERVVWNLLENAVKYSPADAPVEISATVEADRACLAVCNRGPGFPPDRLESLFDLFQRGESESARPGVGLGLAICRTIVEVHGGTIRAENRPDGGACVRVWLPLGTPPPFVDEDAEEVPP